MHKGYYAASQITPWNAPFIRKRLVLTYWSLWNMVMLGLLLLYKVSREELDSNILADNCIIIGFVPVAFLRTVSDVPCVFVLIYLIA